MSQLKVFVSSTCYDLTQIRADLFDFLSGLGYQPVLSEYQNFSVSPDIDTIDNCIQNVNDADLLILIIGNRYGYITDTGKSITNSEYLYAKQKGIPTYIFIQKSIVTILPIWKRNQQADFSGTVDSVKVFEFVEELRNSNRNWCFEFERAQDIIPVLKIQLAHLFKDSLDLRRKFRTSQQPDYWKNLSSKAISICLNKGEMFELTFFAQVLKDELLKYESLKLDLDYHILMACNEQVQSTEALLDWLGQRLESFYHFIESGENLMRKAFPVYYGEPGHPSDLKGLYYVANSLARLFKEMISWSIDTKSTFMPEDFLLLRNTFARLTIDSSLEIWGYPDKILIGISEALEKAKQGLTGINLEVAITMSINDDDKNLITTEMRRLGNKFEHTKN